MFEFIVFAEDWARHPSSTQHLFSQISQFYQVTWVNSVGLRAPEINSTDIKRVAEKAQQAIFAAPKATCLKQDQPSFPLVCPKVLPWHQLEWVNTFNRWQMQKQLQPHLQRKIEGVTRVYWLSLPTALSLIEPEENDLIVYYCGDDFNSLAGVDHHMVAPWEEKLIEQADYIFCASEALARKMPSYKTQVVSHGVDFDLFNQPAKAAPEVSALQQQGPVFGFYGSLSNWLDQTLIMQAATARPNYQFMFIGQQQTDLSPLKQLPNCHFYPAVAHSRLPEFSQHWQASLLPFVLNQQIYYSNPLKLIEYLVAGSPVISTRFPMAEKYSSSLCISDSVNEFIQGLDAALHQPIGPDLSTQLAAQSWQQKASQVLTQLEQFNLHNAMVA